MHNIHSSAKALLFLTFVVLAGACVPNKKVVYLQKNDVAQTDVPRDTILRTYDLKGYEYSIQPEDILSIQFESLTQQEYNIFSRQSGQQGAMNTNNLLISGYLVDKNGYIEFSQIGAVHVAGLTTHEIEKKLQILAQEYLTNPVVKVRLLNFRVTVLGEVDSEGTVGNFNNRLTMMEAIGLAGGLSELADRSKVKVIRQAGGQTKVFYVNLLEEDFMSSPYFFIHQNDIIIVPPLRQRPFRRYFGQNVGLFVSSLSTLLLVINLLNN